MPNPVESPRKSKAGVEVWLAVFGVLLAGVALILIIIMMAPPMFYVVRAGFKEVPSTDAALESWLSRQPHVSGARIMRDDDGTVVISWRNSKAGYYEDPTPNIRAQFESFGYHEMLDYKEFKSREDK